MQKKIIILIIAIIALVLILTFVPLNNKEELKDIENIMQNPIVTIETNQGTIELELFSKDAPITTENFLSLINKGYYNGVMFHRVIKDFMIQGGDPTGTGRGGPGYTFDDELNADSPSYQRGYVRGTLAMANSGPNTNGSQFFIMHKNYDLPHKYTIFGQVTKGIEVVDKIANSKTNSEDKPLENVIMNKVYLGSTTSSQI